MKRSEVTYGQLDRVLRLLGVSCRRVTEEPPAHVYAHKPSAASIILPAFPEGDQVPDYHYAAVRTTLVGGVFNAARGVQLVAPMLVALLARRYGLAGGIALAAGFALAAAGWVWLLPETRGRRLDP